MLLDRHSILPLKQNYIFRTKIWNFDKLYTFVALTLHFKGVFSVGHALGSHTDMYIQPLHFFKLLLVTGVVFGVYVCITVS